MAGLREIYLAASMGVLLVGVLARRALRVFIWATDFLKLPFMFSGS